MVDYNLYKTLFQLKSGAYEHITDPLMQVSPYPSYDLLDISDMLV